MSHAFTQRIVSSARIVRLDRKLSRAMSSYRVRRFAPLDPAAAAQSRLPRLDGIVFDVDGTLCMSIFNCLTIREICD
jgi:hypothetical protein